MLFVYLLSLLLGAGHLHPADTGGIPIAGGAPVAPADTGGIPIAGGGGEGGGN